MAANDSSRPDAFSSESLLVLLELNEDVHTPLVRGVFRSLEELEVAVRELLVERQFVFFGSDDRTGTMIDFDPDVHRIGIKPVPVDEEDDDDLDRSVTAEVFLLTDGSHHSTGLFVWDREQRWRGSS